MLTLWDCATSSGVTGEPMSAVIVPLDDPWTRVNRWHHTLNNYAVRRRAHYQGAPNFGYGITFEVTLDGQPIGNAATLAAGKAHVEMLIAQVNR